MDSNDFTEIEWCIQATSDAIIGDTYEFRVTDGEQTVATLDQNRFLFRYDDGNESGATPLAAENTDIWRNRYKPARLRFTIDATGDADATNFLLECRKVGDTNWHIIDNFDEVP